MNWTCEQIEEQLSDYLDGLLGPEERRAFEAHAADCARCAPLLAQVSGLVRAMHGLEPVEPPMGLERAILDKTLGPRKEKQAWQSWFGWLPPLMQPKFAYGALSLVVTLAVIAQATGVQWRKPSLTDLNPVNMYRTADRNAHLLYARGTKFVSDLRVVYEIQSRPRPEAEPQPAPEQKSNPGQSQEPNKKSPHNTNRARGRESIFAASVLGPAPIRSLQ